MKLINFDFPIRCSKFNCKDQCNILPINKYLYISRCHLTLGHRNLVTCTFSCTKFSFLNLLYREIYYQINVCWNKYMNFNISENLNVQTKI